MAAGGAMNDMNDALPGTDAGLPTRSAELRPEQQDLADACQTSRRDEIISPAGLPGDATASDFGE